MNKQNRKESNLDSRPKRNFLCCACFGRKSSPSTYPGVGIQIKNEPYEYVVEKLAIKKVPLSLFATAEDLEKHSRSLLSASTDTASTFSQKSVRSAPMTPITPIIPIQPIAPVTLVSPVSVPMVVDKPSVTFSAYYKLAPKMDIERVSHTSVGQQEPSDESLNEPEEEIVVLNTTFNTKRQSRRRTSDQEAELVSHILNKHSSLFTLDTKVAVPKDPDNLPSTRAVVPPYVRDALHNPDQSQFPPLNIRKQFQVEVHKTHSQPPVSILQTAVPISAMPPMKVPTSIPSSKKNMTAELKETINALGLAQRPHVPGLPPKNQRNLSETVSDEYPDEQEVAHKVLGGDQIPETKTEEELSCVPLDRQEKSLRPPSISKEINTMSMHSQESDNENYSESSSSKAGSSQGIVSLNIPRHTKNVTVQQLHAEQNDKSVLAIPRSNHHIRTLTKCHEAINTSLPKIRDSEQITEISQLKGQSLKWKIIIKHHSDKKKKELSDSLERSDDSDTDSGSKNYVLDSRRSSPHR